MRTCNRLIAWRLGFRDVQQRPLPNGLSAWRHAVDRLANGRPFMGSGAGLDDGPKLVPVDDLGDRLPLFGVVYPGHEVGTLRRANYGLPAGRARRSY